MNSEVLFVWIYLPEETAPVVAGRLNIRETPSGAVGEFVYGQSYLARSAAIPLDPVSLPLNNSASPFTSLSWISRRYEGFRDCQEHGRSDQSGQT